MKGSLVGTSQFLSMIAAQNLSSTELQCLKHFTFCVSTFKLRVHIHKALVYSTAGSTTLLVSKQ